MKITENFVKHEYIYIEMRKLEMYRKNLSLEIFFVNTTNDMCKLKSERIQPGKVDILKYQS